MVLETDVTVIGGGIMGLSTAYHLAKRGTSVILVEMGKIGAGASGSNAGAIRGRDLENPTASPIYEDSYKMYQDWNRSGELRYDLEINDVAVLRCFTEEHLQEMSQGTWRKRLETWRAGGLLLHKRSEWEIQEPNLTDKMTWGIEESNTMINIFRVCRGLAKRSEEYGARILTYTKVTSINAQSGKNWRISTSRGDIEAEFIVNATGAWAPTVGRMIGLQIPISPAIGTALVTEPVGPLTRPGRIVYDPPWFDPHKPYVSNSPDPAQRLGVTTEIDRHMKEDNYIIARSEHPVPLPRRDASTPVEAETLKCIAQGAIQLVPKLGNVNIIRSYAALRPVCEVDGNPILGEVDGIDGFIMAAGTWHTGMSYGPMSGRLVSELIVGERPSIPLEAFSYSRLIRPDNQ